MFIFQKCSAVGVASVFLNLNRQHVTRITNENHLDSKKEMTVGSVVCS
jgi:hypothetical protein